MVTRKDIRFGRLASSTEVSQIMTQRSNLMVGNPAVTMEEARDLFFKHRLEKLPIVDNDNKLSSPP